MAAPDLATLDAPAIWAWLVGELRQAAASARHGFHLLTAATVGPDGRPDARTVVLRHISADGRDVRFHSDVRSPKIRGLRADPRVALLWYDPAMRVQIRIAATAAVHHGDDLARAAWSATQPMSRICYLRAAAPGMQLASFADAEAADAGEGGWEHFAVVVCHFQAVEVLALHATGHQRVRLDLAAEPVTRVVLAP